MNYLDSHCHLNDEAYDDDLDAVLDRMYKENVNKAMIVSTSPEDFKKLIQRDGLIFKKAIGVYPENSDISSERFTEYYELMKEADAVGEIGLDYHWYKDTKEAQKDLFIRQIKIARELDKPIIVHSREAAKDTFDILRQFPQKGVIHCYSGSLELAKEYVKLGFFISFGGPITWKKAKEPLEVIRNIPLDHLLIETDCPYLTPEPNRGHRNEPSFVKYVALKMMEEKGVDEDTFLKQINANYDFLFGK